MARTGASTEKSGRDEPVCLVTVSTTRSVAPLSGATLHSNIESLTQLLLSAPVPPIRLVTLLVHVPKPDPVTAVEISMTLDAGILPQPCTSGTSNDADAGAVPNRPATVMTEESVAPSPCATRQSTVESDCQTEASQALPPLQ
jgi:hypothetical protein